MKSTLVALAAALASLAFQSAPVQGPAKKPAPAARPSPTPPPVLEGSVKGPDGKPVEKALVVARPANLPFGETPPYARTDTTGRFQIRLKAAGPHTVRVEAAGLAAAKLEKVRPGTPLSVTLAKGGTIEGTVRDSQNAPVPKARVTARDEAGFGSLGLSEPEAGLVHTTTDAKGVFRLEGLGPGLHTVAARARGAGYGRRPSVRLGSRLDLLLLPGATIFGRVTGPRGEAVTGATVTAEREEFAFRSDAPPLEATDATGQFELVGLAPGTYSVIVRHKELAPGVAANVALEKESSIKVDVPLGTGVRVTGRLVTAEGQPVPGKVQVQELDGRAAPRPLAGLLLAEAGADGRFTLPPAAAGAYVWAAVARGYAPQRVEASVPAQGGAPVDVGDVMLEAGLGIRGRVRDQAGTGLGGATLRAFPSRPMGGGGFNMAEGQSEADGRFVLAGLGEGPYRVSARLAGYASKEEVATSGGEPIDIVLRPGGSITGAVVDESQRPVETFTVDAEPASRSMGGMNFRGDGGRIVDSTGRFTLEDLEDGTYVVRAQAPEMVAGNASGVKVVAGQTTDVGLIRLARGGMVRGSVVDSGGTPVPGATVFVRGVGNDMFARPDMPAASTDAAGLFEARGIPAGKADVLASHPNHASGRITVDVDPAKGAAEARVVLTQGGRIEGWARKRDGAPLTGRVQVISAQPMSMDFMTRPSMVSVGPDGSFVVEHVAPGRVRVLFMQGESSRLTSGLSRDVEVREGETSNVDLSSRDILVSGRVTRNGVPQASLRVNMRARSGGMLMVSLGPGAAAPTPASGPQRGTAVTREDGSYELLLDASGEAVTRLETPDGKTTLLSRTDTIPDADSTVLDFALAGVSISGVIVDKQTEKPVSDAYLTISRKGVERGPSSSAQTGPDGRFAMELEPGDVRLRARAEGFAEQVLELSVGQDGVPDLRVELAKGLAIAGRLVDAQGRAVPGIPLMATSPGPRETRSSQWGMTLADGSFRVDGLTGKTYALLGGTARAGFVFRPSVAPGAKDVVLTLQPGGKARVSVTGPDGLPAEGVNVSFESLSGVPTSFPFGSPSTDAQGVMEMELPAGAVELEFRKGDLRARQTVNVPAGGLASAEVVLSAAKK